VCVCVCVCACACACACACVLRACVCVCACDQCEWGLCFCVEGGAFLQNCRGGGKIKGRGATGGDVVFWGLLLKLSIFA